MTAANGVGRGTRRRACGGSRIRRCPARHAAVHRRPARTRRRCTPSSCAPASRTPRSTAIDTSRGARGARRRRRLHGRRPRPGAVRRPPARRSTRRRRCAARCWPPTRVRFIGEPVAVVVAETRAQAVDAAELVDVDYDAARRADRHDQGARRRRAAAVPEERQPRRRRAARRGRARRTPRCASARASSTSGSPPCRWSRAPRSPRPTRTTGGFILWTPEPGPARLPGRDLRVDSGIEKEQLRVISTATGGGFGARIAVLPGADRRRRARARARPRRCATSRRARRRCSRCSTAARRCRTSRSAARATARSPG